MLTYHQNALLLHASACALCGHNGIVRTEAALVGHTHLETVC
jgi:hypothetical protein